MYQQREIEDNLHGEGGYDDGSSKPPATQQNKAP